MLLRLYMLTFMIIGSLSLFHIQSVSAEEDRHESIFFDGNSIESAILLGDAIWLKLTPEGSNQLNEMAQDNLGNRVKVYVLGHKALSLLVVHKMTSERLVIKSPAPELKEALKPYLLKLK